MSSKMDIVEAYRRASLASVIKLEHKDDLKDDKLKPKDTFYLVYVLCLFLGIVHLLPLTFFTTANDMYKFRDTIVNTVDLNNKTTLQAYFLSGMAVVQSVPSIVFILLSTTIAHRYKVHSRIIIALATEIAIFIIFTIFIEVNTDPWQLGFFITTLLGITILTGFLNLFQVSILAIVPKFPQQYTKIFLFGQGIASFFCALMQVVSLAVGSSTENSAMCYFVLGTLMICITLILYLISQYLRFYQYYIYTVLEEVKKTYSKAEVKSISLQLWPIQVIYAVLFLTIFLTYPTVTSLVVSEFYGQRSEFNDVYFVPVATFLVTETCSLIGRALARPIITKSNGGWMVGLVTIVMSTLVCLFMLCNEQPRHNLPVIMKHDWQYVLINIAYSSINGFLLSSTFLSIPTLAPGSDDIAYRIMMTSIGVSAGVTSPISLVAVRIL